jgi:gliding motility-associated protein GldM
VKKVTGNIMVKNPKTGVLEAMKFETEYQVFKGSAVISADAMNVVYIGLDNPISVSVPGFPPDKIRVSITGGTLSGSNGKYIVKPQDAAGVRECVINASVEVEKGKVQPMGRQVYRIKSVPTPKIKYGTLEGGKQSKVNVSVQPAIYASLEGFVFEGVKYDVVEYTYYYVAKGGGASGFMENTVKGKLIDPALKSRIASGRIGDVISINQIRVVGPGGKQKTIASGPTIFLN